MIDIENLIRENIKMTVPYSTARDEFKTREARIFLDANENPFNNGLNRYPDPKQLELKLKLSEYKQVPVENIFLGNGSDEIIDLLIRAFCEPGYDKIIINPPTYGMYEAMAQINGNETIKINLTADFELQEESIIKNATERVKILFLCSPNNPTGNLYSNAKLEYLLRYLKCLVVIDEAYIDFAMQNSLIKRLNEFPNLVVLQTFSKARGLAGIRLGMAFASEKIVQVLNKIKLPYNVNDLTIQKALGSLNNHPDLENKIRMIKDERTRLSKKLNEYTFVDLVYPSDANFLLCKVKNAKKLYAHLADSGIIVRDRSNQVNCENCIRITIGTPEENRMLTEILEKYEN